MTAKTRKNRKDALTTVPTGMATCNADYGTGTTPLFREKS